MKPSKKLFGIALTIVLIALTIFLLRAFNFIWTEVDESGAHITINFLLKMEQDQLEKSIQVKSNRAYDNVFNSQIEWINEHTCTITLEEGGE